MNIKQTYEYLGEDHTVISIAMILAFVQALRCNDFLRYPWAVLCLAAIMMVFYCGFATIITGITPDMFKPLFSIVLIMSLIYYIFFKESCVDNRVNVEIKKCGPEDKNNTIIIKPEIKQN